MISDFNATDILSRLRGGLQHPPQIQAEHQILQAAPIADSTPSKSTEKLHSASTPASVVSEQRHAEGRAVLTALKQEVRRLAAELAAARDENAGLRGELQAAHDKFAQHKLKTDDLVTKLRGKLAAAAGAQSQGSGQGGGSLAGKLYPPPHHVHPQQGHRAGPHWRGPHPDAAAEMKEGSGPGPGPAEGFRDPTFSELMRRANLPSSSTATGRRPSADSGRGMGALTQSSPLLGGAGLGTGLGLGMVGQGDPSFAGYLSPPAMPYSGVGRVTAPMEGIFYLPPGGVQQYIEPDSRIPRYQAAFVNPGSNSEESAPSSAPSPLPAPSSAVLPGYSSSALGNTAVKLRGGGGTGQYPQTTAALPDDGNPNPQRRDSGNTNLVTASGQGSSSSGGGGGRSSAVASSRVGHGGPPEGIGPGAVGSAAAPSSSSTNAAAALNRPPPPPAAQTQTQTLSAPPPPPPPSMQSSSSSSSSYSSAPSAAAAAPSTTVIAAPAASGEKRTKKVLLKDRDKKGAGSGQHGHGHGHGPGPSVEEGDADEDDDLPVINIDLRASN